MNEEIIRQNWDNIKEHIRSEYQLSNISYKTWIEGLTISSIDKNTVTIQIPSDKMFMLNYIENNYRILFQITITEMLNENYEIAFVLQGQKTAQAAEPEPVKSPAYNVNYERGSFPSHNSSSNSQGESRVAPRQPGSLARQLRTSQMGARAFGFRVRLSQIEKKPIQVPFAARRSVRARNASEVIRSNSDADQRRRASFSRGAPNLRSTIFSEARRQRRRKGSRPRYPCRVERRNP